MPRRVRTDENRRGLGETSQELGHGGEQVGRWIKGIRGQVGVENREEDERPYYQVFL